MAKRPHTSFNGNWAAMAARVQERLAFRWWWYAASMAIVLLVCAGYLLSARRCGLPGYPLDDAWIHHCYARTLAQTGQFAFAPGRPSTGSTSPLWTLLLALGHLLRLPPLAWSTALGALAWFLTAWTAQRLVLRLWPARRTPVPWVALACLLEWHLAWAALSGMEIALFSLLSLLLLERYAARARPLWLGLLGGLLVLTRPEGSLLAVALLLLAPRHGEERPADRRLPAAAIPWRALLSRLLPLAAGLAVPLIPYLALNLALSGRPFPSTLYAKQAEYASLLAQPLLRRLWVVARRPLVGAQVLLIPGFLWQAYAALRQALRAIRPARALPQAGLHDRAAPPALAAALPLAWWAGSHLLYALRLPVDYQHGRYLMPTLPILLAYGVTGTLFGLRRAIQGANVGRLLTRVWTRALPVALLVLALAFLVLGGRAYATDRCIIQQEMVDVALWLRAHAPPDALVAAHDIGALGYWAQRPLLDLAGLIDPEVIPVMRDQDRLIEYVLDRQANYLVVFPSWYPAVVQDPRLTPIYPAETDALREYGSDHMTIYRVEGTSVQ
jgi:hypothetical protein